MSDKIILTIYVITLSNSASQDNNQQEPYWEFCLQIIYNLTIVYFAYSETVVIVSDAHIVCRQYCCSRDIILGRREKDNGVLVRKKTPEGW